MFHIAGQTIGAGGSSGVTFSAIPQTFTHLQIRVFGRGTTSFSAGLSAYFQLNGDGTGSNYAVHGLFGDGSSAFSSNATNAGTMSIQQALADSSAGANIFGVAIFDLLDYTNANKNKTARIIGGCDRSGSGRAILQSALYTPTSAITQIIVGTDGNFVQGSRIDLYGINSSSVTGA
jgi:hypothetical protein